MPNWCNNTVSIAHQDPEKLRALVAAVNEGKFCNHVIPVPKELTETVAGHLGEDYAQELNQFKMQLNVKYFGAKDWYDFCTSRWGTKWDVDAYDKVEFDPLGVTFGFDSAWAPPMGVYEELVNQGFSVTAYYYEPGMAFVGKFEDGVDECYDFGGTNSKTVVDCIGEELDEMFGISESMAEYEEEEKDDVQVWYEDGVEKKGLESYGTK
jgi:hypothetical protein